MAMTSAQRKALDRTLEVLAEDLDVTPAVIHLKSKEILQDIDEERISSKVTEKEKVMELVKIIKKRGKKAFRALTEYLENCLGSEHLVEELDENLKTVEAELAGQTLEKDGRRRIEKWKEFEEKFHYDRCLHENIGLYQDVPNKVNVLLVGKTGSGKSATGNTIIGKDHFKASGTSASVTKTIDMKDFQEDRFNFTVIDTPGLFDTAKDFQNEEMLLEIAKTMITFKGGIHLFLLVCSSTRFTAEEQETVKVIEKVLTKNVYKNCVVILTYARAQYGAKGKHSLREHINNELRREGKFAELIKRVGKRVIAVENFFDDDFLQEKHRQSLLCYLAQVIDGNKGSVYSNRAFENARLRVEMQDKQRKERIQRETELTTMRSQIRAFLVQKYLNDLTVKQLDNIYGHFKTDLLFIMARSGVKQLPCITNDDVKRYLKDFIEENGVLIAKLKDMKIQDEEQRKEYSRRRQQLKDKENMNKMQGIVLPLVSDYLKQLSKEDLEEIVQKRVLPDEVMNTLKENLLTSRVELESTHVTNYIDEIFFQNPTEIRRHIDAKILAERLEEKSIQLKKLQRDQKMNATMEVFKTKLPEALDGKNDDEIYELRSDLKNVETCVTTKWEELFGELIGNEIANTDITLTEISSVHLEQNANLIESIMSTILEKRQKDREAKEKQIREVLRNTALSKISEVIEDNLKSYLAGKNTSELQSLDSKISKGEVPDDIYDNVCSELTLAQKNSLSRTEIEREIITQIKDQNEIIEQCKRDAKCFSGSSKVTIKGRGISKISHVKVGDEILVFDDEGVSFFDKVYLISHARDEENIVFILLKTFSGKELFISPGHLIPVSDLSKNVAAKDLAVGDVIFTLQNGSMTSDSVTSISYELCRGAYCPMTMNGTIVVNDVAASCYTNFVPYRAAHILLSPIRVLFSYLPLSLFHKLLPYDEEEGMPIFLIKCRSLVSAWRSLVSSFYV